MSEDVPLNVWNEITISASGIGITLYSETSDSGAVVEDETWFTFDELKSEMRGEIVSLNLSDSTVENLSEMRQDANIGRIMAADDLEEKAAKLPDSPESEELLAYMDLLGGEASDGAMGEPRYPQAGEIVYDENAPKWSDDEQVKVVEVLSDVTCDEYVIHGQHANSALDPAQQSWDDETVADANPGYSDDEPVIIGEYVDGDSTEYAFPASRLQRSR